VNNTNVGPYSGWEFLIDDNGDGNYEKIDTIFRLLDDIGIEEKRIIFGLLGGELNGTDWVKDGRNL
jgi:hypothetical protein